MLQSSTQWKRRLSFHYYGFLFLLGCFVFISTLIFVVLDKAENTFSSFKGAKQNGNELEEGHPFASRINGTEMMWEIPDSPRAAIFIAHGCSGRAANFWGKSAVCPDCVGLPEERNIVRASIERGYAVLAISSSEKCWTFGEELHVVGNFIKWWVAENNVNSLPLVALGASSGGYFVSKLALRLKFSSITLMVAEGLFGKFEVTSSYAPTLFVHMPKDLFRKARIHDYMKLLKDKYIDVAEIECKELPVSPTFFAERIVGFDVSLSAQLFQLLRSKEFVDSDGYMRKDGRITKWREALLDQKSFHLPKNFYQHVQEEMNLAYAYHEMSSVYIQQIFEWFDSHSN